MESKPPEIVFDPTPDHAQDAMSSSNQAEASQSPVAPASSADNPASPAPISKETKSNSYIAQQAARQGIADMLMQNLASSALGGAFSDSKVMDAWPLSSPSMLHSIASVLPSIATAKLISEAALLTAGVVLTRGELLPEAEGILGELLVAARTPVRALLSKGVGLFSSGSSSLAGLDLPSENNLLEETLQRTFDKDQLIFGKLSGKNVIITQKGLDIVEKHLSEFALDEMESRPNDLMLQRLKSALKNKAPLTGADSVFYTHELSEATQMSRGMDYESAHQFALTKYGVSPYSVYHQDVVQELSGYFSQNWRQFWIDYQPVKIQATASSSPMYQQ